MHLLDANTFMEAMRDYYPIDVVPGFWVWLEKAHSDHLLASVSAIRDEIISGNPRGKKSDPLVEWTKTMPSSFWIDDTPASLESTASISTWANAPERPYNQAAKATFMASGDLRLIAQAHALGATVVTREVPAPDSKKNIKIPDVCAAFGVLCVQPFPAYRALGLRII